MNYNLPKPKGPIDIAIKMKCRDCGHVQIVKGIDVEGHRYFGSSYNWCDKCDDGLPVFVEIVEYPK